MAQVQGEIAEGELSSSYGSFEINSGSSTSEKTAENTDIADIKNYFKHKTAIPWEKFLLEVYKYKWLLIVFCVLEIFLLVLYITLDSWRGMRGTAWFSIQVTVVTLFVLVSNLYPPALIFLSAMTLVYAFGVVDASYAFAGFSSSGVITVGILFVIAKGLELSNVLRYLVKYVLRTPNGLISAQIRLLIPIAILSAFVNNTPIVAMMIPVVQNWGGQCGFNISKLMMPLSYAAILGGTCTIIGTSTNIIVADLAAADNPDLDLGFFEIGIVGIPVAIISIIYIILFSPCLLPNSSPDTITPNDRPTLVALDESGNPSQRRIYTATLIVTKRSNMVGKTVTEAGLGKLTGITLFKIRRISELVNDEEQQQQQKKEVPDDEIQEEVDFTESVDKDTIIHAGDTLFFSGMLKNMYLLYQLDGLVPATTQVSKIQGARSERVIVEVVISSQAPFVGKTVRNSQFRSRYNAVIIAAYRYGVRLAVRIGDITLKAGDTLLLEATTDFLKYHRGDSDFALVSEVLRGESTTPRRLSIRMLFATGLAFIMVTLSAIQVYPLLPAALVVACVYIFFKVLTWQQAMDSVQGDTLLVIAAAFGLANALQVSLAAQVISESLLSVFSLGGDIGVLFGLYATTALLSAVISNAATVTLMYPIAIGFMTPDSKLTVECIVFVLMFAASCCFATPVGYQTNLMVMGPGGYTTADFLKFGIPLTILNMTLAVLLSYLVWA